MNGEGCFGLVFSGVWCCIQKECGILDGTQDLIRDVFIGHFVIINHVTMSSTKTIPSFQLWRFLISWQMMTVFGTSVLIVVLSPDDVLTRNPWLDVFVHSLEGRIEPIAAYARVSEFPEVTALYFSIMFFVTPIMSLYFFRRKSSIFDEIRIASQRRGSLIYPAAVVAILICLLMPFMLYVWADGTEIFPSIPIRKSKLSLAATGWVAAAIHPT